MRKTSSWTFVSRCFARFGREISGMLFHSCLVLFSNAIYLSKSYYLKQVHQPRHLPESPRLFGPSYLEVRVADVSPVRSVYLQLLGIYADEVVCRPGYLGTNYPQSIRALARRLLAPTAEFYRRPARAFLICSPSVHLKLFSRFDYRMLPAWQRHLDAPRVRTAQVPLSHRRMAAGPSYCHPASLHAAWYSPLRSYG